MKFVLTLPTVLTLIRLVISPIILPLLIVYLVPLTGLLPKALVALLIVFLGLTDFLDGYLARKYQLESSLGRLLDPLADKFLIFAALIALVAINRIYFLWAIFVIGREFFVMGIRETALSSGFAVLVNVWGKLKTVIQFLALIIIVANPQRDLIISHTQWTILEHVFVFLMLFITLYSGWHYFCQFRDHYKKIN